VTSKKKRSAVSVAFSVGLPIPLSARCNWNRRRSSALALAGERPRNSARRLTARMYWIWVLAPSLRAVMSSMKRRRSGLMGWSVLVMA
jgi:hypothetical protein